MDSALATFGEVYTIAITNGIDPMLTSGKYLATCFAILAVMFAGFGISFNGHGFLAPAARQEDATHC